jgi:glycerophosphoryl diester phosphodiesterase
MTKIIGHRGAMGYRPENTMTSFKKAIELKSHGIELDVHLTKDQVAVVMHDDRVDRTTDRIGRIGDYTYPQIKRLDAGSWFSKGYAGERVPSLEEVLALSVSSDFIFNIELKAGSVQYPGIERVVLELIDKYNRHKQVIVSSFDHGGIVAIKKMAPDIKTGALVSSRLYHPCQYLATMGCDALHPDYRTLDKGMVDSLLKKGYEINTYTVNHEKIIARLMRMGVTGIITNYPDLGIRQWELNS